MKLALEWDMPLSMGIHGNHMIYLLNSNWQSFRLNKEKRLSNNLKSNKVNNLDQLF